MSPDQIVELVKKEVTKQIEGSRFKVIHPSQITPKLVKQRHIDGMVIFRGLAADLPDDNTTGISAYFATDTDTLYIYNGTAWVSEVLT